MLVSRCFSQQFVTSGRNTGCFFIDGGLCSRILCRFLLLPCGMQGLPYAVVFSPAPLSSLLCTPDGLGPFLTYPPLLLLLATTNRFVGHLCSRGSQLVTPLPSGAVSPSTLGRERHERKDSPKKRLHHQQTEQTKCPWLHCQGVGPLQHI